MYSFAVFAVLIACAIATPVKFKDCGSKTGAIKTVDISGCDTFPCKLKRGTTADVQVDFTSNIDTKTLKAVVHGRVAGIPLPFPIPNSDGCKSNCKCPVTKGSQNLYKNSIDVSTHYPKVQVMVKWELRDDNNNDVFCFVIPAEITD